MKKPEDKTNKTNTDEWDNYWYRRKKQIKAERDLGMTDKIIITFQKVIKGWDLLEIILCVIFVPFSLIYILFRMAQEWEPKNTH